VNNYVGTPRYEAPELGRSRGSGKAAAGAASADPFVAQDQGSKAADVW
jgi:hypothetical protein